MPLAASDLVFVGVAKEATLGTAVVPTNYMRVEKVDPEDKVTYLTDKGLRGSFVEEYNQVAGVKESAISLSGPVFSDEIGWMMGPHQGDITTTGASPPYTHAMSLKNNGQPKTITLTTYDGIQARAFAGCFPSDITFKWGGDQALMYDAKISGWASATAASPTFASPAATMIPAWEGTVNIGGATTILESAELSFKRAVYLPHTVQNSQQPYTTFAGSQLVQGKATLMFLDETELTRYLNGTTTNMTFDFNQGAGAAAQEVKFAMTQVQYIAGKRNYGKEAITLDISWKAIANTTDIGSSGGWGYCKVTLQNALPASTFQ